MEIDVQKIYGGTFCEEKGEEGQGFLQGGMWVWHLSKKDRDGWRRLRKEKPQAPVWLWASGQAVGSPTLLVA